VKLGPLGWLLDRLVMKRKLTVSLDAVLASLARHAEEWARSSSSRALAVAAGNSRRDLS
jgi:hypothetical protein